jgi:PPP family 3-phenylpropionic acid transporter
MRYSGQMLRRWGAIKTLLLAYLLFGSSFIGYAWATSPPMLIMFGLVRGVGFGLFLASTVQVMDERAPAAWKSTVQSLREAGMFGLMPLFAAPLAGAVYDRWGPEAVFLIAAAATGVAALVLVGAVIKRWL